MFLVLAHDDDALAAGVYERLRARHGDGAARLLKAEELALGVRWALRQEGARVETRMLLADGARLSSSDLRAVFNRLRFAAVPHFAAAPEADREYALMEMHAFLLGWLAALGPAVVNRPCPRGLGASLRGPAEWLLLAGRTGLPARALRFATDARRATPRDSEPHVPLEGAGLAAGAAFRPATRATLGRSPALFLEPVGGDVASAVVVGSRVCGDGAARLGPALAEGCRRLAAAAGCAVVEFRFARGAGPDDGWRFCGAEPFPADLGREGIEALVALLEAGGEG